MALGCLLTGAKSHKELLALAEQVRRHKRVRGREQRQEALKWIRQGSRGTRTRGADRLRGGKRECEE